MNGDLIAVLLGALSLAVFLIYWVWKKRMRRRQQKLLAEEFSDNEGTK